MIAVTHEIEVLSWKIHHFVILLMKFYVCISGYCENCLIVLDAESLNLVFFVLYISYVFCYVENLEGQN